MLLKYFYDDKLAHASYMVGCQRSQEAVIIVPAGFKHVVELAGGYDAWIRGGLPSVKSQGVTIH